MWRSMCSLKALSKIMHLPHQSQLKCVFKVSLLNVLCWYFQMMCKVTSVPFVWLLFSVSLQMRSQIARLKQCKITLVTFVWSFLVWFSDWLRSVGRGTWLDLSPLSAFKCLLKCLNPYWLHLVFLHYVFSNVSSLWEYFGLQGPWQKVLTDHKMYLYTLQADPEKSRDLIVQNPGILITWKSRDPARTWLAHPICHKTKAKY